LRNAECCKNIFHRRQRSIVIIGIVEKLLNLAFPERIIFIGCRIEYSNSVCTGNMLYNESARQKRRFGVWVEALRACLALLV
jgi:hypothetical protein